MKMQNLQTTAKSVGLIAGTAICFIIASSRNLTGSKETSPSFQWLQDTHEITQIWSNSCGLPLSLVSVKTHKTGSTSLLVLLTKYRRRRQSKNQTKIAAFPGPFAGGYPGSFRKDLCILEGNQSLRKGEKADFLTSHFRFNKDQVQTAVNRDALYVTIVRSPLKQFESSFYYYYGKHNPRASPNPVTCHTYTYRHVTNGRSVNFSEYIDIAGNSLNESAPWFFRSRNYQAFDLGVDPLNLNTDYVILEAKKLDETFHLVLILEHFLESLVLLKELLCMKWQDIVLPSPRNQAQYKPHTFSKREKEIVRKLTSQDEILYHYFNASLWRKIERYGYERMKKDVATLQILMAKAADSMKRRALRKPRPKQARPLRVKRDARIVDNSAQILTDRMNQQLLQKKKGHPQNENLAREIAQYMTENYGRCPI